MDDAFPIHWPQEDRVHRLTVDDFMMLSEQGKLPFDHRHELIEGLIIEMASEGVAHRNYKSEIATFIVRGISPSLRPMVECQLDLPPHNAVVPDIHIVSNDLRTEDIKGTNVLLAIEIADSSLKADLVAKARIYAQNGIQEYWVVDIPNRQILVHRERTEDGVWAEPAVVTADETAACAAIPDLSLRLDDFERLKG